MKFMSIFTNLGNYFVFSLIGLHIQNQLLADFYLFVQIIAGQIQHILKYHSYRCSTPTSFSVDFTWKDEQKEINHCDAGFIVRKQADKKC